MSTVRAKKHLGQHFLKDQNIAQKIAETLTGHGYDTVLEIGPGMGVLTEFILQSPFVLHVVEIDRDSVAYLKEHFPVLEGKIYERDFLKFPLKEVFGDKPLAIIGNFPYNISTQIVFKVLEQRHLIPEFSGMFQKEVAERICETKGSKTYGILSVLVQAFYEANYLFTVPPHVFSPPPKVQSGVLQLIRKPDFQLPCNEKLFFSVVKSAFNQRRKTLRNSLKSVGIPEVLKEDSIFDLRPEQLSTEAFIALTQKLEEHGV
jgi:16S rRNA (adenine1518-N6/adenine1519-N6)-dimethyltransferase